MSQIHEYMAEKVIPESVMPQNIPAMLLDEDGGIPELDAFTFLNRVRALGIGSADFLYLLKGCNAPEQAIEKIERNPAMNLQSLVVTLESAGLTSRDYTRMLYTARQIWERTLTMRIEKKAAEQADDRAPEVLTARQKPTAAQVQPEYDEDEQSPDEEQYPEEYEEVSDEQYAADEADGKQDNEILTARQKPQGDEILTARQKPKTEYISRGDYEDFYDEDKPVARHKGKIAVSAVFAALLMGLNGAMYWYGFGGNMQEPPVAAFAENSAEIFADIYTSYTGGRIGGGQVMRYAAQDCEVFGDMLVTMPQELGSYTLGGRIFAAQADGITVYEPLDGSVAEVCTIQPPDGAEFIEITERGDMLCAVYSDSDSAGVTAYNADGTVVYSVEQSGVLTDLYISADSIALGTVYTPPFTQSFRVEQTEFYLPQFTLNGTAECILPTEVMTGEPQGCSYAVRGCYSLDNGSLVQRMAALGDPVFSGAEQFLAVMADESGYTLLGTDGSEMVSQKISGLVACDIGDTFVCELAESAEPYDSTPEIKREAALVATAEKDESGALTVYLRGFDYQPVAAIANIQGEVTDLDIRGGMLYISGDDGVLMVADISEPAAPVIKELSEAYGVVRGDSALCSSISGTLVKLTLYRRDESDAVAEAGSASDVITLPEGRSVQMLGGNTFFIGEERFGAAYSYFDGVSMISRYAVFGRTKTTQTLFDKSNFSCAAELDGTLYLIYGGEALTIN